MSFLSELATARQAGQATSGRKHLILTRGRGGIRGLCTARAIQRLQAEVPLLDQVELFAGTSTARISALGLADRADPADLIALCQTRDPEFFDAMGVMYRRVRVNLIQPIDFDDTSPAALGHLKAAANSIPATDWQATRD